MLSRHFPVFRGFHVDEIGARVDKCQHPVVEGQSGRPGITP